MSISNRFKVYFIGICGISTSALAVYLSKKGFSVSGSDVAEGENFKKLASCGVLVHFSAEVDDDLKNCDLVVYSSAIGDNDVRLLYARSAKKALISRAELLARVCDAHSTTAGISGTHGKTACTAMLAHIMSFSGKPFDAHIGGRDLKFGNLLLSGGDLMITEICEYKRNISLFSPTVGVILNVDCDHLESYGSLSALACEFKRFSVRSGVSIVNADDKILEKFSGTVKISLKNSRCDYYACDVALKNGEIRFKVFERGKKLGTFKVKGIFLHDVYNALAAIAAARFFGADKKSVKSGLADFKGVFRREEFLGKINGASVFADYCHHPRQICDALAALRRSVKGRLITLFQPHTYSRTKNLFEQFVRAFDGVSDITYIVKTYAAREAYDFEGSAERLCEKIEGAIYVENIEKALSELINGLKAGDVLAVLGAGDLYFCVQEFLKKQKAFKPR